MLIPTDCVLERTEKIQNVKEYERSAPRFTYSTSLQE